MRSMQIWPVCHTNPTRDFVSIHFDDHAGFFRQDRPPLRFSGGGAFGYSQRSNRQTCPRFRLKSPRPKSYRDQLS